MTLSTWVLAGALLAAVLAALLGGGERERRAWRIGLVVAALVYPAVAMFHDAHAAAGRELVAALPWLLAAGVSRRSGPLLLAVAWALHGVLDMFPATRPWMPAFYPPLCLGFDLVVAVRLVWLRDRA